MRPEYFKSYYISHDDHLRIHYLKNNNPVRPGDFIGRYGYFKQSRDAVPEYGRPTDSPLITAPSSAPMELPNAWNFNKTLIDGQIKMSIYRGRRFLKIAFREDGGWGVGGGRAPEGAFNCVKLAQAFVWNAVYQLLRRTVAR